MKRRIPVAALVVVVMTLAVVVGGVAIGRALHKPINLSGVGLVTFLAFPAMGLLILRRQPANRVAWLLLGIGLNIFVVFFSEDYAFYALIRRPGSLPAGEVAAWLSGIDWLPFVVMTLLFLPLLFPDGRLPSRRWRLVVACGLAFALLAFLGNAFQPGSVSTNFPQVTNPLGMPGFQRFLKPLGDASVPFGLVALLGSFASVVARYRRASGVARRQLKWFLLAVVVAALPIILTGIVPAELNQVLVTVCIPLLPISIAIAILRYRLYDIDLVINRALVYGVLAAFISAVYIGIVVGLGALIGSRGQFNLALSILATAVVALAFQPFRQRVQRIANRLVYGERASPYDVLATFSQSVAGAYANEEVLPRLARVLVEGTGAVAATVWLRGGSGPIAAATWPPTEAPVSRESADPSVGIRHQGEELGWLTLRRRPGERLAPVEAKLLADLAAQAGQVLRNVRLTAELQARVAQISSQAVELRQSRQRIVAAQDAERQRLERNIHDGAQQHLVALAVKLRLAASQAQRDPKRARSSIDALRGQTKDALETLQALAAGLYPPVLREGGIGKALLTTRSGGPVSVGADGIGRYADDIEAAVYFCCQEAIQNAIKHSRATRIDVVLREAGGVLTFSVTDDGVGFDPATARGGAGLQNMADRIAAIGGELEITSAQGAGCNVRGRVPVTARVPAGLR